MIPQLGPGEEKSASAVRLNVQRKRSVLVQAVLFASFVVAACFIAFPGASSVVGTLAALGLPFSVGIYGAYVGIMLRYSMPEVRLVSFPASEAAYPRGHECKECGQLLRPDRSCPLCDANSIRPLVILFGAILPWAAPLLFFLLPLPMVKASGTVFSPLLVAVLAVCALGPVIALAIHLMAAKPWRRQSW